MGQLFVTGFGPFEGFEENPSEVLVRGLRGFGTAVLPVSYEAADLFLSAGLPAGHDRLLMLGAGGPCDRMRVERVARNLVCDRPDVDGRHRSGPILHGGPATVRGGLFGGWRRGTKAWAPSSDAGGYVCNYLYYSAATGLAGVRCGFVHVPPFESAAEEKQRGWLAAILKRLEREA